jgi:hypothetical protein
MPKEQALAMTDADFLKAVVDILRVISILGFERYNPD